MVGLGKNPMPTSRGNGWGRKSHISKAQNITLVDMATRKKLSIFGALRASHAPKGVPYRNFSP
jgi:hypothetical protein